MFSTHHIAAQTIEERALVAERIKGLSKTVMTAWEWHTLLTAAETLLPRRDGKRLNPVELDLAALGNQPRMQLFAGILHALAHEDTYQHNRRYATTDWTRILESFDDLSLYLLPPPTLSYGPALCALAMKDAPLLSSIRLANALSRMDIRVLHQRIRHQHLEDWNDAIVEVLRESIGVGEHIRTDDDVTPDEYDDWRSQTKGVTKIADDFYEWSKHDRPDDLEELEQLISIVERPEPPDEDEPDIPSTAEERDPSYWTLERIFEDL